MKKIIALTVASLLSMTAAYAENNKSSLNAIEKSFNANASAVITGKVVDNSTGEPLTGVCVYLPEINKNVYTDFEGNFNIVVAQPGKYTIKTQMISYTEEQTVNIEVKGNEVHALKVALKPIVQ